MSRHLVFWFCLCCLTRVATGGGLVVFDHAQPADGSPIEPTDRARQLPHGAVVLTERVGLRVRPGDRLLPLYGSATGTLQARGSVQALIDGKPAVVETVTLDRLSRRSTSVSVRLGDGRRTGTVTFAMGRGQPYLGLSTSGSIEAVRLNARTRLAVMPDFFADDLVLDARSMPVGRYEMVADRTLLLPVDEGSALLMPVWENPDIDVTLHCEAVKGKTTFTGLDIPTDTKHAMWIALAEARGIWHLHNVGPDDAGKHTRLNWTEPFAAQWRIDWHRRDGLSGSWEMIRQRPDGRFTKLGWGGQTLTIRSDRRRWTTVLGRFAYPAWIDRKGRGHVQPLGKGVVFRGPALVYPVKRTDDTPASHYTVGDLLRETLGVGPCRYILDVEGQSVAYRGMATCEAADKLNAIYKDGRGGSSRDQVEQILEQVLAFMQHIRGRIDRYTTFADKLDRWLVDRSKEHPGSAESFRRLLERTRQVATHRREVADKIGSKDDAAKVVNAFRRELLGRTGDEARARCAQLCRRIVEIGGNQDELAGRLRMDVKRIRQQAMLEAAGQPALSGVAREVRRRSREVLQNPAHHEGAFH